MNSVVVLILGFAVAFIGYRFYARYIDTKVIRADEKRTTPAKMFMDGVEFMPTSRSVLYGYQFKSIAGLGPIVGPIIALQWGWLPALLWVLLGTLFIGWVHDYSSAMITLRNEGASFGRLSHTLISPRARLILLSFIYFYLLLILGAFGNIVVDVAAKQKYALMAWVMLTIGGVLAGQMIYRWKRDIILTTVVTVFLAMIGIWLGTKLPSDYILGVDLAQSKWVWVIAAFGFCYFASVLPIWRFALPINYVASYIVFLGLFFGIIGVIWLHPTFSLPAVDQFTVPNLGPIWPVMFVTIACGAVSGWHSIVSSSGTARQLESELDARPVGGGVMFLEMILAVFAIIIAATFAATTAEYVAALKTGPARVFVTGIAKFLGALGLPTSLGTSYGSVMLVILAITIMQLVVRFMRVATSELLADVSPVFRNVHIGTIIASLLGILLVMTGWYQYLWTLFGGANQLMASLALMLVTAWLISEGKPSAWTFYPMIFMFLTTVAALLYKSYELLGQVFTQLQGQLAPGAKPMATEALVGNTLMGFIALFLVIAAIILAIDGFRAFHRFRNLRAQAAPAKA